MCDQKDSSGLRDDEDQLSVNDKSEPEESLTTVLSDPELDDSEEDEDEEPCDQSALAEFSLKGGSSAFSYRTRNIFDCLDRVTPTTSSSSSSSSSTSSTLNQQAPTRKTSQPPPSSPVAAKRKGTPDYLLHPERWTHYSLEGVSETSEQGNKMAAFNFLSELQERKEEQKRSGEKQQGEEEKQSHSDSFPCEPQHRMIFCRPNNLRTEATATERSKKKEMHLNHLLEEQEEEKHTESGTGEETGTGVKEEVPPVFTTRKMRSKNYRRGSEGEEL
ncbi:U5 small nuclear ribonucleoprotein TSSC4 [Halichoeres trimaculatus]|uniref:U5 small nuclear ribonucleoprotein TSSC4 n=1 Tax=Halichoeres trimaculatus TaxID=147232 RepID=UPI003D9DB4C7